MRQIDDSMIEAKLRELDGIFGDLSAKISALVEERARVQGEFRAWESLKTIEPDKAPGETH